MSDPIEVRGVRARRAVMEMPEYHPPLAGRDALRLDFNENTFAPSPKVMERIAAVTAEGLTKYPEREPVERMVASHYGLEGNQVLLTNGVDEAIHSICVTFLEEGDEALVWTPSFFMYDVSIGLMGGAIRRVQSDATMEFPLERMLASITERTKVIFVASPNNPTGAVVRRQQLLQIAEAAPEAVLLVDEAYFHFHGETTLEDVKRVPNLLVARTFSKAYGLANLRVGMVAGDARLVGYLRKVSSPYNVNGVALECLKAALEDEAYVQWYVAEIKRGRERVMRGLEEMGVGYFPSQANFVLMRIGSKQRELVEAMRARGVLLRDRSSDPGCEGFVRMTIGVEEQVTQGLAALKGALEEIAWTR